MPIAGEAGSGSRNLLCLPRRDRGRGPQTRLKRRSRPALRRQADAGPSVGVRDHGTSDGHSGHHTRDVEALSCNLRDGPRKPGDSGPTSGGKKGTALRGGSYDGSNTVGWSKREARQVPDLPKADGANAACRRSHDQSR